MPTPPPTAPGVIGVDRDEPTVSDLEAVEDVQRPRPRPGELVGGGCRRRPAGPGASTALAFTLERPGLIALQAGDLLRARQFLTEALRRFADSGNTGCSAHCLEAIGGLRGATTGRVRGGRRSRRPAGSERGAAPAVELRGRHTVQDALEGRWHDEAVQAAYDAGNRHDPVGAVSRAADLLG